MSEQSADEQATGAREAQAANLFDLRRIIGGLFVLYGVVLTVVGLGDSDAEIEKAAGVHINLWAGLGMLVLGLAFLAWGMLRPLGRQLQEEERKREERGGSGN
jgi:xanthine/uracil/vitamin C permease (AzgA family)